jgi:GT2 family glycosyltransferase
LFLDDDDEVQPDLIERHLRSLARYRADVSCGVADEVGAGALPEHFSRIRASDVFPTNNAMVTREALRTSGLFDLAYNRGQRADRDLGMRLYLSGALMVLNPEISVLHHHAPSGGLRTHKARVITYASSRKSLTQLQIPSATEFYLERRYFTRNQVRESMWIRVLSTFGGGGGVFRKLAKMLTATALLPDTIRKVRKNYLQATDMLSKYPKISSFPADGRGVESAGVLSEITR